MNIPNELSVLAEKVRGENPSVSCILFALAGAVTIGLEREMVEPIIGVTLKHHAIVKDALTLSAEFIDEVNQ